MQARFVFLSAIPARVFKCVGQLLVFFSQPLDLTFDQGGGTPQSDAEDPAGRANPDDGRTGQGLSVSQGYDARSCQSLFIKSY